MWPKDIQAIPFHFTAIATLQHVSFTIASSIERVVSLEVVLLELMTTRSELQRFIKGTIEQLNNCCALLLTS